MTWNMSTFSDLLNGMQNLPLPLLFLICFGLSAVGAGFLFSMPLVGTVMGILWGTVMGEQAASKATGRESGTEMGV